MVKIEQHLAFLIREIAFLPPDVEVGPGTRWGEFENWDSMAQVELLVRLEQHYEVRFEERDMLGCATVGSLTGAIERKLRASG